MAVKASATITLTQYRDTQSVTRYYKLQTAGSSAPLKPETKPPSSDWTDSEPACDISKELYFCDLTIFSNGEWEYSKVSKSSSYEAAKEAYNKAQGAKDSIDNLEIGGRNLILNSDAIVLNQSDNGNLNCSTLNDGILNIIPINNGNVYNTSIKTSVVREKGVTYTISFDVKTPNSLGIYWYPSEHYTKNAYIIPSDNWQKVSFTYTQTGEDKSDDMLFGFHGLIAGRTYYLKNFKLEKGNKATDWTPAPEDVDAGISEAQGNALSAEEAADALDQDLIDFKSNEYSQINDKVGELVEYKGENEKEIGKIRDELSQELVAQKFARVEPDKGSLILGEINGTTAVLTNEQFGFYTPNSEIAAAYFGKDNDAWAFNIERGIIKNDLRFSGFQWIARSNKNMSLKWIK